MALLVVIGVASVTLVRWGAATATSARVEAVADLAALAGVVGGESDAREVARRNGGVVERFVSDGARVTVTVRLDGLSAVATAEPREDPVAGALGGGLLDSPP